MTKFFWGVEEENDYQFIIKHSVAPKVIKEKPSKRRSKEMIERDRAARLILNAQADIEQWIAKMDQIYLDRHESLVRLMQAPEGAGQRCKRRTSESELDVDAYGLKQASEPYLGGIDHL
jgi:hypothetical protein